MIDKDDLEEEKEEKCKDIEMKRRNYQTMKIGSKNMIMR